MSTSSSVLSARHEGDDGRLQVRQVEAVMGTVVSIHAGGPEADELTVAVAEAVAWLHEVEARFTVWQPGSEWLRVMAGELPLDDAHPDIRHVATVASWLTGKTEGAFSLTANPDHPPDPSAYVKGWALQRTADLLVTAGADSVMVNGGGDIAVAGGARPWRLGVQDPFDRSQVVAVVELSHGAMATSGTYERGDHIHTPGRGAATGWASVSVVGPDLGLADAYSTAAFAMGPRAPEWLAGVDDYRGYFVDDNGRTLPVGFTDSTGL